MFYGNRDPRMMGNMMGKSAQMAPASRGTPQKSPMGAVAGVFGRQSPPPAKPMGRVAGTFGGGGASPFARSVGSMFGGSRPAMAGSAGGTMGSAFGARPMMQQPGGLSAMQGAAGLMSDRHSKERIAELDDELEKTYAALEEARAEYPATGTPHHLDDEFQKPSASSFEYKPEFRDRPGAGRGRFAGPMTDELKGIPGVVSRGADGMERVNEPRLTMANTSQIGNLTRQMRSAQQQGSVTQAELDRLREQLDALEGDPDAVLDRAAGRRRK
jgi:hypothetical protein